MYNKQMLKHTVCTTLPQDIIVAHAQVEVLAKYITWIYNLNSVTELWLSFKVVIEDKKYLLAKMVPNRNMF